MLGEFVMEIRPEDFKIISEKLEVINLSVSKKKHGKSKTVRWILIALFILVIIIFAALAAILGSYLNWDYSDPELAVAGTILHGFEFIFVKLPHLLF